MKDPTLSRGVSSKNTTAVDLFDTEDMNEVNGIMIWDGEDPFDHPENESGLNNSNISDEDDE